MTRTAARLAALSSISRERPLTDDEITEVKRLTHLERQCARRRERYAADPAFRQAYIASAEGWRRARGMRPIELRTRDERGRFA
jgi:hypothetical protein